MARKLHFACALHKHTHDTCARLQVTFPRTSLERYRLRTRIDPGETMRTAPKKTIFQLLSLAGVALAALAPTLALAADAAPVPNKGDTAWMLTSTALVLLMAVPALGLFYGGLVRSKNMLSVLMQTFVGFSLITAFWCLYAYSPPFT